MVALYGRKNNVCALYTVSVRYVVPIDFSLLIHSMPRNDDKVA